MGCICSKGATAHEHGEAPRRSQSLKRLVSSSKREEVVIADTDASVRNDGSTSRLIRKPEESVVSLAPVLLEDAEKKAALALDGPRKGNGHQWQSTVDARPNGLQPDLKIVDARNDEQPSVRLSDVPNGFEGEHVAAGWPSWLTSVAGEAVRGWLPRRADSFERLNKIGQGTYSNVYKARDLKTGKIVALKKVRFVNLDPDSVRFMAREIHILRRLDHPNVVKLEGLITSRVSCSLYLVFEYMEHDLAGLAATPSIKFTEPQVKCYMKQLLCGLDHCHSRRVLHRDIKGSNLLIDNNGILKIADFGLATFFNPDKQQSLTSRVVTLWYRPPELLLGATEYGVAVDLWSTGCILAELLAGKPIMPGRTEVEQLHKIFKLCGSPSEEFWRNSKLPHATIFKPQQPYRRRVGEAFRDFPPSTLVLLDRLLAVEPADRGTAASALASEFFNTKPFACDPSNLPKYPPSKEYDAKLRDEDARRQKAAAVNGHGSESGKTKAMPVPDSRAELQKRQVQANLKSSSAKYKPYGDSGSGFPIDSARGKAENVFSHLSSNTTAVSSWSKKGVEGEARAVPGQPSMSLGQPNGTEMKAQRSYLPHGGDGDLSNFSDPVTRKSSSTRFSNYGERVERPHRPEHRPSSRYSQMDGADCSERQEWAHNLLDLPASSHNKDNGIVGKESTMIHGVKKNRVHKSGPLMPPGGNIEEMLKEHERQIQQAVRKARLDKSKMKYYGDRGLSESLLYTGRNGRSDRVDVA